MEFTTHHERQLEKLYVDMYEGNGPNDPSITTRMSSSEIELHRQKTVQDGMQDNLTWIVRLIFATLLAVVGDIVVHAIKI